MEKKLERQIEKIYMNAAENSESKITAKFLAESRGCNEIPWISRNVSVRLILC